MLTEEEMKAGVKFKDVIGYSGTYANAPEFQIPYGCLVPAKLENLLAAGRCVSAEFPVADTLRLIPVCRVTGQAGIAGLLAPVVRYEKEYCLEDCNACTQFCPSGALQDLNLEQKNKYVIGETLLDASLCYLVRGVNDCNICVRSCPFDAVQIYWNEDLYVAYPVVDLLKCNGCGTCEAYCPTGETKAIKVWKSGTSALS